MRQKAVNLTLKINVKILLVDKLVQSLYKL